MCSVAALDMNLRPLGEHLGGGRELTPAKHNEWRERERVTTRWGGNEERGNEERGNSKKED